MSVRWITAVYAHRGLDIVTKAVLLAIADSASDQGRCYPSINHLSDKTGGDRRTVIRAVKRLEDAGYFRAERAPGRSTEYFLTNPENWCHTVTSDDEEPVAESHQCQSVTSVRKSPNRCHTVTPPVSERHPNRQEPSLTDRLVARACDDEPLEGEVIPTSTNELADTCARIAGIANVAPAAITKNIDIVNGWIGSGCDPGLDIIPTIQRLTSTSRDTIHSLRYFDKAVRHEHAKRTATAATGGREPASTSRAGQKPSRLETAATAIDRAHAILRERKASRSA